MNTGLDILFFAPDKSEVTYDGKLYLDVDGRNIIEFAGNLKETQFEGLDALFATDIHTNEKYTLVNCAFNSFDFKTFRYCVHEVYKGDHLAPVINNGFLSVEARMTYLTRWINHPRFCAQFSSSIQEPGHITIREEFVAAVEISENMTMELHEYCGETFERREVRLKTIGFVRFISKIPVGRLEIYSDLAAFQKLLSFFTDTVPKLTSLEFTLNSERVVELLMPKRLRETRDDADTLMDFPQLQSHWPAIIKKYYEIKNDLAKVVDLLIESLQNKTAEVSFLNATTAFEIYHKTFFDGDRSELKRLSSELHSRGIIPDIPSKWIQIVRYYHIFEIVKDFDFFKAHFTEMDNLLVKMRESRNYYTHYGKVKTGVWTPNQLFYINRALRQLLKAAILRQLGLSNDLINGLLNNRAAYFYHNYERNKYSLNFLPEKG